VHSNYDIDIFRDLISAAASVTGSTEIGSPSLRVIADHIRACSFLIVDGVMPSNEGRGYVLRRIIRRAVRHGYKLGQSEPFFYKLVPALVVAMGESYPELAREAQSVARILKLEEQRFAETLSAAWRSSTRACATQAGIWYRARWCSCCTIPMAFRPTDGRHSARTRPVDRSGWL